VKKIVDDDPKVDVSSKNSLERDALMTTCFHGYRTTALRIAHFLLQCGARPTERDQVSFFAFFVISLPYFILRMEALV
jgi:hypothetical protein